MIRRKVWAVLAALVGIGLALSVITYALWSPGETLRDDRPTVQFERQAAEASIMHASFAR
jgi:hypothetical protein